MSITVKVLQGIVGELRKGSASPVHQAVANHLDTCKVTGCERFSVGGACRLCSRHACTAHLYLTAAIPPVLMCAECIALEFEVVRGHKEKDG